jgi:hypothetical protein
VNELRETPFFAQPGTRVQSEYLYFSFVALTTLGFGDLSPSVGLPQALTVLEALLGQIFLVTLVARLVTLWVRQRANEPSAEPDRTASSLPSSSEAGTPRQPGKPPARKPRAPKESTEKT